MSKLSAEQLREARSSGFKRKKPKAPKTSASLDVWKRYEERVNAWAKAAREKIAAKKKKEADKKTKEALIRKLRG